MDASGITARSRFTAVFEWVVAAAFLSATVGVGAMLLEPSRVYKERAVSLRHSCLPEIAGGGNYFSLK